VTVARNELKYVAEVETDLSPLPPVSCYVSELSQVLLNLLGNAAHAIADAHRDGFGRTTVRSWSEGDQVYVSMCDPGCGIPEVVRERIFDAFFTTKEVSRGTGPGLALARSVIVDRHEGTINFHTEIGKGTTFLIGLPLAGQAQDATPRAA
jgi:two-component system, NtrC family, sensor kinase